jgi:two-component system, cell cycle sensor histidine kinase and response regulator CckA
MGTDLSRAGKGWWGTVFEYSPTNRLRVISIAAAMMGVIAVVELVLIHTVSLGFLYIIPLVLAAGFLKRWQIVVIALACAVLREASIPIAWSSGYLARIAMVAITFSGVALFARELVNNRQIALELVQELKTRQQLERQLVQAQRLEAVGRLAGGIAHDFNNLLSVIIGFSDLALRQLEPGGAVSRDIQEISRAADRASALTRQLLEFSRRDVLQPKVTDLNGLVSNLANMLRRLIGEDIELDLALEPNLSRVSVDARSIEQVIMNLVVNSRDAMPRGGKLTIRTAEIDMLSPAGTPAGTRPGRRVTLSVEDTGTGMEPRVQEHLFEPFFTTKDVGKGTGLGLSTVYGIVKQNGGDIWFLTEPGRGTTFTIYLRPTDEAREEPGPPQRVETLRRAPATVLLVEDDNLVRKLASEILTRNGLTVIEAGSASEAVAISKRPSFQFDLLLTDVVMPEMSGPRLAEKLAEDWPSLNVLFMTGYADPSLLPGGRRAAPALIQKPLSEASLMQAVRAALTPSPETNVCRAG